MISSLKIRVVIYGYPEKSNRWQKGVAFSTIKAKLEWQILSKEDKTKADEKEAPSF